MKKITYLLFVCTVALALTACTDDEPKQPSIFTNEASDSTYFDRWLRANYNDPYNIRIIYRYQDYETDQTYNVIPAKMENVKALAKMMKHKIKILFHIVYFLLQNMILTYIIKNSTVTHLEAFQAHPFLD